MGSDSLPPEEAARLSPPGRYRHFVARCVAEEQLWGLRDDEGWAMVGDGEGGVYLPVWPHREIAERCATDQWQAYEPAAIALVEWLAAWLPSIAEEGWGIAVFPTPEEGGVLVEADQLRSDLESAIQQ